MAIHLINPSELTFGTSVITCRWPYVLAAATLPEHGTPLIVDETLRRTDFNRIRSGDIVGISVHTLNAARGYAVGSAARERGAWVVFGGVHASLFPEEAFQFGAAHSVVIGDGDLVWSQVLADCARGEPQRLYTGGRVEGNEMAAARWDLLPANRYLWGAVQTVRGCPKHCSFCSVWRTDGQRPRLIPPAVVVREVMALRRLGFRYILLSDDNFYPVTLRDLELARTRGDAARLALLQSVRQARFELMEQLAALPDEMTFFTQITMEAAEDPEFLKAMRRAHIRGALIGVESVTPEGLKSIYKGFNRAGEDLVAQLQVFARHRIHILGSFIFGLPTDRPDTFALTTDIAHRANLVGAQFVILTPFPGTVDFQTWEKVVEGRTVEGVPMNRYWLAPSLRRNGLALSNSAMTRQEISAGTQEAWDRFYSLPLVWERSRRVTTLRERLAFILISKMYRQMYARTGFATDSARSRAAFWARVMSALCRRLFKAGPEVTLAKCGST